MKRISTFDWGLTTTTIDFAAAATFTEKLDAVELESNLIAALNKHDVAAAASALEIYYHNLARQATGAAA